jgi:gamma-glutamylputrescine oxidase
MSVYGSTLLPSSQHVDSYYAATCREHVHTTPLDGDADTDVCVIGGGYAGLGTALHLARRNISVTLLEQSRLGWGASGRNGGQVHVGMRRDQPWLEKTVGEASARRFWHLALDAREHLDWVMHTYQIECSYRAGLIHADHKTRYVPETREHVDYMRSRYGYTALSFLPRDALRELLVSDSYHGGSLDLRGGHLQALDWALGIARAAQSHGASLYEGAEVTSIHRDGDHFRVTTGTGTVRARRVVLACNGYLRGLSARVRSRVMPINNYVAVTEPLGELARALITNGAAVSDSRFVVNYFRMTPDDRLLFGGGENYSYRFPADIAVFVRPHVEGVFPQLRGIRFDYAWGGTLGITSTRMPFMRELEPGLINLSGFSGLGVVLAPYAGKVVADALAGERASFELLAGLSVPPFPGGPLLRWPTLVAAMLYYALRDRL